MLVRKQFRRKGDNWSGPYEISECVGEDSYRLKRLKGLYEGKRLKLHETGGE